MDIRIIKKFCMAAKQAFLFMVLLLPALLVILPILLLLSGSLMDIWELGKYISPAFTEGKEFVSWKLLPDYPTFTGYGKLLFETPEFFVLFWNSMKLAVCILAGQLLVAVPAAWGFAVYQVRESRGLFALYVVLMLLPFQVTMLSSYLVLNKLSLLNTHQAIILPAVFSTFPVFLSYGGFKSIPCQMLEAARVDGAGEFTVFVRLGIPLGKSGLLSAMVLGFLEYWSLLEQPMAFLENKYLWPLSLYLPQLTWGQAGFAFCASVITLIPAVFVFAIGQDYLEQGIIYSGLKE
ncbi:carbohydrate ABC transporter permease [Parablautia intestinalis]|uniref:Carbohydrate ABC transporter permease n=1 Tax=Parablautia intestinalis TaxID=2320100 RepID=A0A3A9AGC6_9FIRM|nr:carbohydrate ABC transporter permease [Parablautia intestinalis]MCI8614881.1 carbohydrate ABC transporter permease [Lachnospiraceae bacterium]MDE7049176.1 carbohydrate ABC transporter permease [Lachnospiraceae bacterium]RKI90552.1 carbohydrate ABC transporter permease [Parablautia intestinalis]